MIGGATGKPKFRFTVIPSGTRPTISNAYSTSSRFDSVIIIAVAMSTTIGANFTLLYPERVRALALCSWYELEGFPLLERRRKAHQMSFADLHLKMREILLERGRRGLEDYLEENHARLLPIFPVDKPVVRRKLVELFASHQPAHYVQSAEFYTSMPNLCAQMHQMKCPVLGICGTDDPSPDRPELMQGVAISVRNGSRGTPVHDDGISAGI